MSEPPLVPASLYGLRTWRLGTGDDGEELRAACRESRWPPGGRWLHATCGAAGGHAAPHADCACGIHAWHPRRSSARRVLAGRFDVPGIVEAAGPVELQDDGFRAQRARPWAFVVTPGRNRARAERLARRYDARIVEVADADALAAWCDERGLGLSQRTVAELLGPEHAREVGALRRRDRRRSALRVAAVIAVAVALVALGAVFASGPPSGDGVYGRTGWVTLPERCAQPAPAAAHDGRAVRAADDC